MGMRIELDGGKYTAIFEDNGQMKALRHGEPWRDITGDNLTYFLMCEVEKLRDDLSSIGAGGVESLRKPSTERPSYEFSSKNRDGTWTPWLPLGGGLKFENVKVRQQHTSNAQQRIPAAERPDSPCVALCTTLYDEYCRGCGRHYLEVARWGQMTDVEKGEVWARLEGGSEKCTPSKS